jgi:N-acetyltransferase 10
MVASHMSSTQCCHAVNPSIQRLSPHIMPYCLQARFMALLGGAFKPMGPALALSLLDPKLTWADADAAAAAGGNSSGSTGQRTAAAAADGVVMRGDGSPLNPYDLKRLQVRGGQGQLLQVHISVDANSTVS